MKRPAMFFTICLVTGCGRVGFDAPRPPAGDSGPDWSHLPADPPPSNPAATVQVSNLRPIWTTSEWTFWAWATVGVAGDLDTFEFTIAESMVEAVNSVGSASTTVFEGSTMASNLDLSTLGGLLFGDRAPNTAYVALLVATDTGGLQSVAVAGPARTLPEPTTEIVLFHDEDTPGYSIPADLVRSNVAPWAGTHHYAWTANCGTPSCLEILRRQDLGVDLSALDANNFNRAFVEFAAASNSVPGSVRSSIRLWFGTAAAHDDTTLFAWGGWFMSATDEYRVYQFPLAALTNTTNLDVPLTLDIAHQGVFEFGVGGQWSEDSVVRLDEWRIRW